MKTEELFNAIRSEDLNKVEELLTKNSELVNQRDQRGSTPLLLATYYGNNEVARTILKFNPEIDAKDASGNTALMGVCFKGYITIAELLLAHNASVNLSTSNLKGTTFKITFKKSSPKS